MANASSNLEPSNGAKACESVVVVTVWSGCCSKDFLLFLTVAFSLVILSCRLPLSSSEIDDMSTRAAFLEDCDPVTVVGELTFSKEEVSAFKEGADRDLLELNFR